MAERNERKKSKGSKGNEGEEGTDGSKQKGGAEGKYHQKRSRLGGSAHFVHKRVTGQPKLTPKKKEGKSFFDTPPPFAQETSQQQLGSALNPTAWAPWEDATESASVAVISSVPSGETLPSIEGATPPTAHDIVTSVSDNHSVSTIKDFGAPDEFGCNQTMSGSRPMNNPKIVKSDAYVGQGASGTQLDPLINQEWKQDTRSLIMQGSKEENEAKGNDYEQRFNQLTKSLNEKEIEVTSLKLRLNAHKALLEDRLKRKDKECIGLEVIKLQLERELATAKEEVTLLKKKFMDDELKEKISAADKRDSELMIKQVEDLKKEGERNIAEVTRRIDELEETRKEQLKEIDKLREENTVLKGTIEEQGNMREKLTELEALHDKVAANHEEEMNLIRREEETKRADLEEELKRKFDDIAKATQHINALEEAHKEQLKEIDKLRVENTVLKGTIEEQGNMREKLTELEALRDKVASHEEEMNLIRREEEIKRAELEEEWKRFDDKSEQRIRSHLQTTKEAIEGVRKKYRDRLQAREMELQAQLDKFSQENKELKEQFHDREGAYRILQDSLDRKSATSMELEKRVEDIMKHSEEKDQKIKEISERLTLKETENEVFKQDFISERNDREKINAQLIKLQAQHDIMKHESAVKDKEAQIKFHNLQQTNSSLMHDLEMSREDIATRGAEIESLVEKNAQLEKEHTEEIKKIKKKLKESETGETDRVKLMEEDIQVLTAQVNAYSREVDKQKGLVSQSQEKHKTEVSALNERLDDEIKSKHQLDNGLARMRQQLDDVSADKEELLRAYHQEQARLEDQIERMKQANKVLMEKIVASKQSQSELNRLHEVERQLTSKQEEVISLQKILSGFQNTWELSHREVSLLEELGRGGWGVVWVGQLRVAVKKLHERIVSQHNMETFHREINIMSQLRHPNLLQFIGAVLDHPSGYPMIVTEVMDTSLREAYESKELTPDPSCRPVILSILHDVAEGLNYLHCLPDPIIHRDVSSANVLLQSIGYRRWKGKVSDFGSAKLAKKAITKGPGAFVYSAPEAFQNIASQDPTKKQTTKMDVFSYGVLLCEIITCRFPNGRDVFQDMIHQVHGISNRPSGTRDTQGSLLHSLIVSCCHDDPSRRPTMKQIIEQLDVIAK